MVRRGTLSSLCALVLWMGGCPKRQGPTRVVYVPAPTPPAAATAPTTSPRVLVIEEPAPVEAEPAAPPVAQASEEKPPAKHKPPVRTETATSQDETPETSPPPAEVPALEQRASAAQESALRLQTQRLQEDVRQRLGRLNEARLSANEHKTLEDARTFLAQSTRALESGDLQRGFNLARKASLLVASLE